MKRLEMIPPFDILRGNASGRQNLLYPTADNKAYDAPDGKTSYARNYTARYIGAKISATGHKTFQVKTRNGVSLTESSKKAMAVMGACNAIYSGYIMKVPGTYSGALKGQWQYDLQHGIVPAGTSFRKWFYNRTIPQLRAKEQTIDYVSGTGTVALHFNNPWVPGGSSTDISIYIKPELLVKFYPVLSIGGQQFKISGIGTGIFNTGMSFNDVMTSSSINVLSLRPYGPAGTPYGIQIGTTGPFLVDVDGTTYIKPSDAPAVKTYKTTDVAPSA